MRDRKKIIFLLSSILLMALGVLALVKAKQAKDQEEAANNAEFLPELTSGIGKGIGAIMLLIIVLVGGAIVMVMFGIGYGAKKAEAVGNKVGTAFENDFDKNLDRTVKGAQVYRTIKGR